jgi:hypothetical protein
LVQVNLAVASNGADVHPDGTVDIIGVFTDLHTAGLPAAMPQMCLVLFFEGNPAEVGTERTLAIQLLNADGDRLGWLEKPIVVPQPVRSGSRSYFNEIFIMQNVVFPEAGDYEFVILLDDDAKRSVPIYVNEPAGQPMQGGE